MGTGANLPSGTLEYNSEYTSNNSVYFFAYANNNYFLGNYSEFQCVSIGRARKGNASCWKDVGPDLIIEFSEMTPNQLLPNKRLHRIANKPGSR